MKWSGFLNKNPKSHTKIQRAIKDYKKIRVVKWRKWTFKMIFNLQ